MFQVHFIYITLFYTFIFLAGESVDEKEVLVSQQDFNEALENLTPSLTDSEIQRYRQLRDSFSNDKDHQIHDKLVTGQLLPDNIAQRVEY